MFVVCIGFALLATNWFAVDAQLCGIEVSSYWCPPSNAFDSPCCVTIEKSQIRDFTITTEEDEAAIARLQLGFRGLEVGLDIEEDTGGTLETRSVTDTIQGRQVICFAQSHLLCYYRESTVQYGRRICSTILHELRYDSVKSPKCFGYEVCGADACEEDDGDDEDLSFWDRERTVSYVLIGVGALVFLIIVCICCCVCCG